jgi:hypothetical protein
MLRMHQSLKAYLLARGDARGGTTRAPRPPSEWLGGDPHVGALW